MHPNFLPGVLEIAKLVVLRLYAQSTLLGFRGVPLVLLSYNVSPPIVEGVTFSRLRPPQFLPLVPTSNIYLESGVWFSVYLPTWNYHAFLRCF